MSTAGLVALFGEIRHPDRFVWGHFGATIGGETRGTEGNRSDAKPQVTGPFSLIAPGSGAASSGLENRKSRKGLPGSNPGPPAIYLRFRTKTGPWWGRIGATTGGVGGSPGPPVGSATASRRHGRGKGEPAVQDQTVRRNRCSTLGEWPGGVAPGQLTSQPSSSASRSCARELMPSFGNAR